MSLLFVSVLSSVVGYKSEGVYSDAELLRDLLQFQSNLDPELRVWLIDQKPKNVSEAASLADQYVAVRKVMILLQTVMLLSQSHLVNQDVVTLLRASRKLRLVTILSRTMSSSPRLLPLARSTFYG